MNRGGKLINRGGLNMGASEIIDWSSYDDVIRINKNHTQALFGYYNPLTGEGSPIPREKLCFDDTRFTLLPKAIFNLEFMQEIKEEGSVKKYADKHGISAIDLENAITRIRINYDFEFWAATCGVIQDKQSKKDILFILRNAQRKLLSVFINSLFSDKPVRIILLKARQWGGSTLVQLGMAWIQMFLRKSWHSVIVADVEDQARVIRSMYSRMAKNHPKNIMSVEFAPFEGSTKNRQMKGRDSVVFIGSMKQPDSIRSADIAMAHLSEVGLWRETQGKKPEDIIQSISGSIPNEPYSVIVMESTAKGVGTYFHREWQKAVNGENGYTPVFVAWWEIEFYRTPIENKEEMYDFIQSMTDREKYVFSLGATIEGIKWYRDKKHNDSFSDWRMACEFPSTADEAFQSTGRRAHSPEIVNNMRHYIRAPKFIGDMFADSYFKDKAINNSLRFQEVSKGNFYIWQKPDTSVSVKDRYVVSMDIGGRSETADYSVITVIDRYFLMDGGVEELVARWRGHLDQDIVIWKAVQIATYYSNALLVVESNSLDIKGSEGNHSLTILDEIKDYYDNLYCRTDPQRIREGEPAMYGFHTNAQSKRDLITHMNQRYRENGYIEHDVRAIDEMDYYEIKSDSTFGAVSGEHDDIYMSTAIALKASSKMTLPVVVEVREIAPVNRDVIRTAASF